MLNFDSILAQKYNWKFAKLYFDEILIQFLNRIQSVTLKRLFEVPSLPFANTHYLSAKTRD